MSADQAREAPGGDLLLPTGINTKLYCPVWKDKDEIFSEVQLALSNCVNDVDTYLFEVGWTGIGLWFVHSWV